MRGRVGLRTAGEDRTVALGLPVEDDDDCFDWTRFYTDHAPPLRAFIRKRVPSGVVEDTLQDTFVRAFRSHHRYDPTRPLWPWLVTLAIRACAEARRVHPQEVPSDDLGLRMVAPDLAHESFERRQRAEAIAATMAGLPIRHRRVLVRWEIDRVPYEALVANEGLTLQALKSVLCRARSNFRKGYRHHAERIGLAGIPAFGTLLRRLRIRVSRLSPTNGDRVLELALGGFAVITLVTAAAAILPTGARGNAFPVAKGMSLRHPIQAGQAVPENVAGTDVPGKANDPKSRAADDLRQPVGGSKQLPLGARATPDVHFTPDESTASLTLDWTNPLGDGGDQTSVTLKCNTELREAACAIIRATPGGAMTP